MTAAARRRPQANRRGEGGYRFAFLLPPFLVLRAVVLFFTTFFFFAMCSLLETW
jgi:hypothetical protein